MLRDKENKQAYMMRLKSINTLGSHTEDKSYSNDEKKEEVNETESISIHINK